MKAIGFTTSHPISHEESFMEFHKDVPEPEGRDLLVKIEAISVNPVDYKIRQNSTLETVLEDPKIIGWDAIGTVVSMGESTELFKKGDRVFYAGDLTRPGSNQEYQLIDERIVGFAPKKITAPQAASMPLTSLTAWELLFDRIRLSQDRDKGKTLLIIGGAGGVGSIAIQLAKKVAGLTVLATASRPETKAWCEKMGADHVVDHRDLVHQVHEAGFKEVDFIADFVDTNGYWDSMVELIKPQGHIASITGNETPILLNKLKTKSVSFSWEFMYTRSMYQTDDMIEQHHILNRVAGLLDSGTIISTLNHVLNGFTVANLNEANELLESNKTIGKIAIEF
ncbi:zinc-binding alcohol dehydrogenase family protein [Galbibacter sp. BG1]|uniref:zinc-binding alcohol dehydrogenase family protein n=1 Tax=Galbibacter sp. BG1 TaxID=1170699 RepID=UPI0015BB5CA2|nr:zinc-binding alcohol dehydrogenase family protein [Galbibacter sp. BG1]QLE02424.1 zinc-binding alcohol dehydrogenase family protein [Galbibacter sp. BG1]